MRVLRLSMVYDVGTQLSDDHLHVPNDVQAHLDILQQAPGEQPRRPNISHVFRQIQGKPKYHLVCFSSLIHDGDQQDHIITRHSALRGFIYAADYLGCQALRHLRRTQHRLAPNRLSEQRCDAFHPQQRPG